MSSCFFNLYQQKKKIKNLSTKTKQLFLVKKILIFSYGSLVKQKENKKTGAQLYATSFKKTSIQVPISFTFLAGYPVHELYNKEQNVKNFPHRRATATIDSSSRDNKYLWVAESKFVTLHNARNNLAAREGAPFLNNKQEYDCKHIFYIKKVDKNYLKKSNELSISGFDNWITLKAQLTN